MADTAIMTTRRKFLAFSSAAVAATALPIAIRVGAVARSVQSDLRETVEVTRFMGALSVRAAFQAALNTGKDVFVPRGTYTITGPLSTTAAGQQFYGEGEGSKVICTGTNADANVLEVIHADCMVEKLWLVPGTTVSDTDEGWGVLCTANRMLAQGLHVSGMRRGGVMIQNANNCTVIDNRFTASVVTQNPASAEAQRAMGFDVYLFGSSSFNVVMGNQCVSGCGVGIGLQGSVLGEIQYGNVVKGNIVDGHPCYGIMLYSFGSATPIADAVIADNTVRNISGVVYFGDGSQWFYGAGIYVSGARKYVITGNRIKSTNTDNSKTYTASSVPAAIAMSGWSDGTCTSNVIEDCYDGIYFGQSLLPDATAQGLIQSNRISGMRRFGINLVTAISVAVKDNTLIGTGYTNEGIVLSDSGLVANRIEVVGNFIATFNNGINMQSTNPFMRISGNKLVDIATHGIYATGARVQINDNDVAMKNGQSGSVTIANVNAVGEVRGNTMTADTNGLINVASAVVNEGNILKRK